MSPASSSATDPALLRTILDHAACGVIIYDALRDEQGSVTDFHLVTMNQEAERITGFVVQNQVGRTARGLNPDLWPAGIWERAIRVMETGVACQQQVRLSASPTTAPGHYNLVIRPTTTGVAISFVNITAIEAERELLAGVIEHIPNGLVVAEAMRDAQRVITDFRLKVVNPAISRFSGLDTGALQASLLTIDPSLVQTGLFGRGVEVVETGEPFTVQYSFRDRYYSVSVAKLGDGFIASFIDVTSRQQANEALRYQQSMLEGILNTSQNSITVFEAIRDGAGTITDFRAVLANPASYATGGKSPQEIIGKNLTEINPATKTYGLWSRYIDVCNTRQPYHTEQYYVNIGRWVDVQIAPLGDGFVATYQDITARKQAELAIQQQALLVQGVLDATLTAVASYEPVLDDTGQIVDFRYTLANQAAFEMLGLPPEVLYTKTLCELTPGLRSSDAFDRYVGVIQTGEPITMEQQINDRWHLVSAVRFDQRGLLTSSFDITEIKQVRQQIEQINAQLRRSNESLDQFASIASHDLQEPLRKIRSFGDILATQYASALGDGVTYLRRMQSAAERMQVLIRDLLTYSRLSKSGELVQQSLNLNGLVSEVLVDLEVAVQEKKAVISVGSLPTLPGDAVQMRQLFQNLLSNALKFSKPTEPPRIQIACERIAATQLPEDARPGGKLARQYWQIAVMDNGIGFSNQYRETIFGAFERLHSRSSAYGGSGIGLAIVRKVLENHQGSVTAQSQEGVGATFTLYLPAVS